LLAASLIGCGGGKAQKKSTAKKGQQKGTDAQPPEVVESALHALVVGPTPTDYAAPIRQLNSYVASHADRKPTLDSKLGETFKGLGGDPSLLAGDVFTNQDLDFILDVQSLAPLARMLKQADDAATARKTFDWVVRHIELAADADAIPAGMYVTLLRGRGSPQTRTWVFVELLRQQGVEGAVVEGLGASPGTIAAAFVKRGDAVDALLFDAEAGAPIPDQAGAKPLTLREALKEPQLLQITLGKAPASSPKPSLLLAAESSAFAPRLAFIGEALSADARLPLASDLTRWRTLATAAGQGAGALGIWDWTVKHRKVAAEQRDAAWDSVNPYWRKEQESPLRSLLAGDADAASKQFIKLDFDKSVDDFAIELRLQNLSNDARARWSVRTRQDVIYFGGLSQLEKAESNPGVARSWFERYLKQFAAAEFGPESILAASRISLAIFTQGTQGTPGPGHAVWKLADPEQQQVIELCARDEASMASLTEQQHEMLDRQVEELLAIVEDMTMNPFSESERQAGKHDPRADKADDAMKSVMNELGRVPSSFGDRLLKRHFQSLNRRANESLQISPGVKEGMEVMKSLSQRISQARAGEAKRSAAAKPVIVAILTKLEHDPKLADSPDYSAAHGALTGDELTLLRSNVPASDERRREAIRKLIAAAFGPELLTNPSTQAVWVPAALRNLAACRWRQGQRDAALAALKTHHAAIQPIHRRELDAWLRILEKHPKWPLD